jgi:hypothetical protein
MQYYRELFPASHLPRSVAHQNNESGNVARTFIIISALGTEGHLVHNHIMSSSHYGTRLSESARQSVSQTVLWIRTILSGSGSDKIFIY